MAAAEQVAFLRTLKEEYANRRRWRFWHKACLVCGIELLFIFIGGLITMGWFNIEPYEGLLGDGVQTSGPVIGTGLLVSRADDDQNVLVHSGKGEATVELRAADEDSTAGIVLSGENIPGMGQDRFSLEASDFGDFVLRQGGGTIADRGQARIRIIDHDHGIRSADGVLTRTTWDTPPTSRWWETHDVDIELDPGSTGEVTVHNDVSIGGDHIRTRTSNLTVEAANNSNVQLVTGGNGSVKIYSRLTASDGSLQVAGTCVVGGHAHMGSSLRVGQDARVGGDSTMDGLLTVGGEGTFSSHVTVSGRLDVNSEAVLRQNVQARSLEVVDRLDASGHMFIGTSNMDQLYVQSHISSRTLIFDEDHSFAQTGAGSLQLEFPDPDRNERISFPEETGTVLTTISPNSQLERVGNLIAGSIREGFGGAHLAYAEVDGAFITHSSVNLGDSDFDLIKITGRMTNDIMVFDKDEDGVGLTIKFPDPSSSYQGNYIEFPDGESGTVLTTVSPVSALQEVGALSNGSIVDGFGPAHVQSLISSQLAELRGDSILGSRVEDSLFIAAHISSPSMMFDGDSNGRGMLVVYPDNENTVVTFPNETGIVLSSSSDYSTLKHVSGLLSGSLEPGFGAATVASLHSTGDTALDADVAIGLSTEESLTIRSTIRDPFWVFDANADGVNSMTIEFPDPAGPETITFPAETGDVLTTVSLFSSLTSVGILGTGELGPTFGDASVASLTARGNSALQHDVVIGTNQEDSLEINGHITSRTLVFDADKTTGGRMSFSFPHPATDRSIVVPDESGDMLTSSSRDSVLTSVGALVAGSIGGDFGDIIVNADIRSTDPTAVLAAAGDLHVDGSATLGNEFADEVSVRGTFIIKNNGQRVFDVNPEMGDTRIEGNLQVAGVIRTDSSFGVAEMQVATINEFELDGGVTIEGVLIRDGGILHTKMDRVDELIPGHGVTIDGVVMKNGALITESATGTTAKGEVDMVRIINTGHDADMDETITNIKFRQTYHDLTGNEEHEESDMAKISAVTESDWTQREDSRSAYLKLSVVNSGVMEERMRLTAEGDMLLNTDSFIVDGPTGDTLIHGNVLVTSRDGTDERELAITSSANTASLRVEGGDTSPGTMIIKGGATGNAEATLQGGEDMDASLTFVDPSATDGSSYSILVDGASNFLQITGSMNPAPTGRRRAQTVSTDVLATFMPVLESTNLNGVTHTYSSLRGAMNVTGELAAENCDVRGDMVSGTLTSLGNTQLGSNASDSLTIPGRLAQGFLLVDAAGDADPGSINITFPQAAVPYTIGFPAESGEVITTASNFSTLQAVGDVSQGNLIEGFGKAEVNSLVAVAGSELRGGVSIGNATDDPIAVHGFITTDHLVFDGDNDGDCLVLMIQDPATDWSYQGEFVVVDIDVVDNMAPEELRWQLIRIDTGETVASAVGQVNGLGGIQGARLELLPNGQEYKFTIFDDTGTGIWNLGGGEGVQVNLGGVEVGSATRNNGFGGPGNTPVEWSAYFRAGKSEADTQTFCSSNAGFTPGNAASCTGASPEYVGTCAAICTGTRSDTNTLYDRDGNALPSLTDCKTAFNVAPNTTAASCPAGCTYAVEGSHTTMAACNAAAGLWISYRCEYSADDPSTGDNEEACSAELIPVPPAAISGAGTRDPEYTGQWEVAEACKATDPNDLGHVATCAAVDVSGDDDAADRTSCGLAGGGVCTYVTAVAGHCSQGKTNIVHFPQEDGTLIAKHAGTTSTTYLDGNVPADVEARATGTYLEGNIYLGTENSDRVMFPGQIDGTVQYASSSAVLGTSAMHFGADTYGTEQHYEICEPRYKLECGAVVLDQDAATNQVNCEAVVKDGTQLSACTYYADDPATAALGDELCSPTATDHCASVDISVYSASWSERACEGNDPAAAECTYSAAGGDAYTSAYKLTLGAPPLVDDLLLMLPHENGVILSNTSQISSLVVLGDLNFLNVDGDTEMRGDITLGNAPADKVNYVGAIHGTNAMSFDGGYAPSSVTSNVAQGRPVSASSKDDDLDGSGNALEPDPLQRTASQAVDGAHGPWLVPGHGMEHMWMSGDSSPYHWLAIDLQTAFDVTGMEIYGANDDGTAGDLCDYSLLYRPYTMGQVPEVWGSVISNLRADYGTFGGCSACETDWKGVLGSPRWSGPAQGWLVAFESGTVDQSHGYHTFASVKTMHVRLDISMSQGCRDSSPQKAIISEVMIYGTDVRALTTLSVVAPTQDRTITLPDETGTVLTHTSLISSLTRVGALSAGSTVSGFGPATIDLGLTSTGTATLDGDVYIGDAPSDSIYIRGSLVGDGTGAFLQVDQDRSNSFELTLALTDPTADQTITFPDETGEVLTTVSEISALTTVGNLISGNIGVGFGDIEIGDSSTCDINAGTTTAVLASGCRTLSVAGSTSFGGQVVLGAGADGSLDLQGPIRNTQVVFEDPASATPGKVILTTEVPAVAGQVRTVRLPNWTPTSGDDSRFLATRKDTEMADLATVGTLSGGAIGTGFGAISTADASGISTTGSAPIVAGGPLEAKGATVLSGIVSVDAIGGVLTVPTDTTVYLVRQPGSGAVAGCSVDLPDAPPTVGSASPDGQMLLVKNSNGNPISTVSGDGSITILAGESALFIYMGAGLGWSRFVL